MLSQNNTSFLDTVLVVQEKVVFCLYSKHGQEAEKSYMLFVTLSNTAEAKKKHFGGLFHNQGMIFMGLSNAFPVGCDLKKKLRLGFQRRRYEFCSVFRDFNSKIQRLLKTHIINLS